MSLDKPYDDQNVFARIIRGELPAVRLHEDERTLTIMDAFPQSEGHALVIPKTVQAVNLLDLPTDILHACVTRAQLVAGAIVDALDPDGVRLVQFSGEAAGQSVFHVHFHVVPVYEGLAERRHGADAVPTERLEATAELIRARL